jgi:hypothetical protein
MNTFDASKIDMSKLTIEGNQGLTFPKPSHSIAFHQDNKEVGHLDFNGPEMTFEGDMDESCRLFMQFVAQSFKSRLDEEYQRGYDAAKKENA